MRFPHKVLIKDLKRRDHFRDLRAAWRIILKRILNKEAVMMWTGFIGARRWPVAGRCKYTKECT
jgi:hypothetical protein